MAQRKAAKLNEAQVAAVHASVDEPLVVVAGAGSGKTMTLTHRVLHILQTTGCAGHQVLCITFTRNAACEMSERLQQMAPKSLTSASRVLFSTIHALGMRVCRHHIDLLDMPFTKAFGVVSESERRDIVTATSTVQMMLAQQSGDKDDAKRMVTSVLRRLDRFQAAVQPLDEESQQIYLDYKLALQERNLLDFHDLVAFAKDILACRPEVAQQLQATHRYVLIDEYQDTSQLQEQFLRLLVGPSNRVTAVGDGDQSIYSFNGADPTVLTRFVTHFRRSGAVRVNQVNLVQNYRSSGNVVNASNAVIAQNLNREPKTLFTSKPPGEFVHVCTCRTERCEWRYVVHECQQAQAAGIKLSEVAVLCRTNKTRKSVHDSLKAAGVPVVVAGQMPYSPAVFQDVLALLKLEVNPNDDASFERVCRVHAWSKDKHAQAMDLVKAAAGTEHVGWCSAARWVVQRSNRRAGDRKEGLAVLKKLVQHLDLLSDRLEELSLAGWMRRVLEWHPMLRKGMQGGADDEVVGELAAELLQEAADFQKVWERDATTALSGGGSSSDSGGREAYDCSGSGSTTTTDMALGLQRLGAFLDHVLMVVEEDGALGPGHAPQPPQGNHGRPSFARHREVTPRDAVWLGTVHKAKGLEWKVVVVVRFNDGEFPVQPLAPLATVATMRRWSSRAVEQWSSGAVGQ